MGEYGLTMGTADVRSAGPITFGPDGILFLADNDSAKIFAIDVADPGPEASGPFDMADVDTHVGSFLGCAAADLVIRDLAVHPVSGHVYLSVRRGHGDAAQPVLIRVGRHDGSVTDVPFGGVSFAEVTIEDAPAADDARQDITLPRGDEGEELEIPGGRKIRILRQPIRTSTVTDLAYVNGDLLVAGLSNEEFSSKLRRIPFPFTAAGTGNNLEIFHVSHGKWETAAPIRTFVPYDGGRAILASYTCTPVVHFPLGDLEPGTKTVGRTVAELGPVNQPLDMVSFTQGGEEHLLVANSAHGLVKIDCRDIDGQAPLTEPYKPYGVPRETKDHRGITHLANLDGSHVLALQTGDNGSQHLRSLKTDSL